MSTKALILSERNGKLSRFVDPTMIENAFQHNVELLRRSVGQERVRVVRNTFVLEKAYNYATCDTECAGPVIQDTAKLVLSGANPSEVVLAWESLKANVDKAIASYNVTHGVPVPLNAEFSIQTESTPAP